MPGKPTAPGGIPPGTPGEVGGRTSTALLGFRSLAKAAKRGSSSFFSLSAEGAIGPAGEPAEGGGNMPEVDCLRAFSSADPGAGGSYGFAVLGDAEAYGYAADTVGLSFVLKAPAEIRFCDAWYCNFSAVVISPVRSSEGPALDEGRLLAAEVAENAAGGTGGCASGLAGAGGSTSFFVGEASGGALT